MNLIYNDKKLDNIQFGMKFRKYRTKCTVVNYDDVSDKYIFKIDITPTSLGYVSREEILENLIKE